MRTLSACSCRNAAVLVLLAAALPGFAQVSDFPTSAYSRSLNMRPEFVDETSLLFVFPQRAGILGTRFLALGAENYSVPSGVGFHAQTRGFGGFLLAQEVPTNDESPVFQAGFGSAWEWLRWGVAGRIARQENESGRYDVYLPPAPANFRYDSLERTLYQGALGFGLGGEGAGADLAFEAQRLDARLDRAEGYTDTLALHLETDGDPDYGVAGRFHLGLGGDAELIAVGGWGTIEVQLAGLELFQGQVTPATRTMAFESWHGGLAASFSTDSLDWLAFSAHWHHREAPTNLQYGGYTQRVVSERAEVVVSLRQMLWRELLGCAGVGMAYEERTNESSYQDPQQRSFNQNRSTTMRGEFAWGVSYVWRHFDVRTAVRANFPTGDLFAALDLLVHL